MLRFLLDTTVLSEPTRARPDAAVLDALRHHRSAVATASVVWHELTFGVSRLTPGPRRATLEDYLADLSRSSMPILPYDAAAARWHADQRAELASTGWTPAFADGQVAAIAAVNGLEVVTRNTRDFARFDVGVVSWWR